MARKRTTEKPVDPSIETPTTPGTVAAQEAPPETASPPENAESGARRGSPDRRARRGSPDPAAKSPDPAAKSPDPAVGRQTAAPTCPECGTRCVAGSSPAGTTYYYCPVAGCGYSTKQARPASGLGVPTCPYHKQPCEVHRKASNAFFVIFRCPEPGCAYTEKRPRPNLPTRRRLADERKDQSAR